MSFHTGFNGLPWELKANQGNIVGPCFKELLGLKAARTVLGTGVTEATMRAPREVTLWDARSTE